MIEWASLNQTAICPWRFRAWEQRIHAGGRPEGVLKTLLAYRLLPTGLYSTACRVVRAVHVRMRAVVQREMRHAHDSVKTGSVVTHKHVKSLESSRQSSIVSRAQRPSAAMSRCNLHVSPSQPLFHAPTHPRPRHTAATCAQRT